MASKALWLPDDVWLCVADLVCSEVPSQVDRRLQCLLHYRHVRWSVPSASACAAIGRLKPHIGAISSLHLDLGDGERFRVCDDLVAQLCVLRDAASLQVLFLSLARKGIGDTGAKVLGQLGGLRCLRSLHLVLDCCEIGDMGGAALALLGDGPSLSCLTLSLVDNHITARGMEELSRLSHKTSLTHLHLDVRYCSLGVEAASTLAAMLAPPIPNHLHMDLRGTELGIAAEWLQGSVPAGATVLLDPSWVM
eukprot:GGOE01036655.1.p1 GENE.GGOE01036655.1~~GGOE01036655.1.p1  ORF type:complete len:250 (-),score=51.82 GGOE01036655.1:142-891(-)